MSLDLSRQKRLVFTILTAMCVVGVTVFVGEILIRLVDPVPYLFPKFQFSRQYGFTLYEDRKMIHERPGRWKFVYSVNRYGHRGPAVPISNVYDEPHIVVLGDSFSFGQGVADGEEYAAVMANALKGQFKVANLAVPAWGLTQEIRRYYEFGQLYSPVIVILQFCINDPTDNLSNPVTTVDHGRFVFSDSKNRVNVVKRYLSDSLIQKSQVYNLLRNGVFEYLTDRVANAERAQMASDPGGGIPVEQGLYSTLLEAFAKDLTNRHIRLLMIAVDGQLDKASFVREKVDELNAGGYLRYYEVTDWLRGLGAYRSPEGHEWDSRAHRLIGLNLAAAIQSGS
jgi:hypothetical protein